MNYLGSATGFVISGIISIGSKVAGKLINDRKMLEAQKEAAVTIEEIAEIDRKIAEIDVILQANAQAVQEYENKKRNETLYTGIAVGAAALISAIVFFKR